MVTIHGCIRRARSNASARRCKPRGSELVAVEPNPIDTIWTDRPAPPLGKVSLHARKFAGEDAKKKLARVLAALAVKDALLVSDPHAVAWLFNIRGHDVAHTPLPLAYALILKDAKPRLYIDPASSTKPVHDKLAALVSIRNPDHLVGDLDSTWREAQESPLRLRDSASQAHPNFCGSWRRLRNRQRPHRLDEGPQERRRACRGKRGATAGWGRDGQFSALVRSPCAKRQTHRN